MNKRHLPKNKRFSTIEKLYKDEYLTEDYILDQVMQIYWPIWKCQQSILIEKELELNRFSRIILELIQCEISSHQEICAFLGIEQDSFLNVQFHFLLKNDLIQTLAEQTYVLTTRGIDFLSRKKVLKKIESIDFEYYILEGGDGRSRNIEQVFFDPNVPIDPLLSEKKKIAFRGYRILQGNRLESSNQGLKIAHNTKKRPSFVCINRQRNDFAEFFSTQFKNAFFYDFNMPKVKAHQHFISFLALFYQQKDNPTEIRVDIRHSKQSVIDFGTHVLEEQLSKKATQHFQRNPTR